MIIQKNVNPGMFEAIQTVKGDFYCGIDDTMFGAVKRCLDKINWKYPMVRKTTCKECFIGETGGDDLCNWCKQDIYEELKDEAGDYGDFDNNEN